jgi:hypothetical protein
LSFSFIEIELHTAEDYGRESPENGQNVDEKIKDSIFYAAEIDQ